MPIHKHLLAVAGKNNQRYSVLSYCNRNLEAREHGLRRAHEEKLSFEQPLGTNSPFERDLIKIKQAPEWRRLQAIYQFAVPLHTEQQHLYQNRITHTEDVEDVGSAIARRLRLDRDSIDLVRCIAAIHDMGHMPFTHWGEEVAVKKLAEFGHTWKHDAAGLRVITEWCNDGLTYPGLNLTLDTIEGLTKRYWHYRPGEPVDHFNHPIKELPADIRAIDSHHQLYLGKHNHVEGQIAAIADWIAFTATDIEDGLRSGWITLDEVTTHFPGAKKIFDGFRDEIINYYKETPDQPLQRNSKKRQEALNKKMANHIRDMLIQDVVAQTNANTIAAFGKKNGDTPKFQYGDEVRDMDQLVVGFTPGIAREMSEFQKFCRNVVHARMIEQVGPVSEMVSVVIDDFVSGKLPLEKEWEDRRQTASQQTKPAHDIKGDLTELACEFLVREATDTEVINYVKNIHPDLWREKFEGREPAKANGHSKSGPFAERFTQNALRPASQGYFR